MQSERIVIKKKVGDLPEDEYPHRVSLGIIRSLMCVLFHREYHYAYRFGSNDDDMACAECKVQWIS